MFTEERTETESALSDAFPKFTLVDQLGQYTWNPGHNPNELLKPHSEVTVSDITTRISRDEDITCSGEDVTTLFEGLVLENRKVPLLKLSALRLPIRFLHLPPQEYPAGFPNDAGYIVPLFVAVRRGLKLEEIDFALGGSSLEFLAKREVPQGTAVYLAQRTKNVILLTKSDNYIQNYADIGFQFERLVTGTRIDDQHDISKQENLQVMQIGEFKVLFSSEVDAIDDLGRCVEIKSGNPRYFGTKVMFQMISSGSKTLVYADKRGLQLVGIKKRSINDVIYEHSHSLRYSLQDNIINALRDLKTKISKISEMYPSEVGFAGRDAVTLTLIEVESRSVLPRKEVVEALLYPTETSALSTSAGKANPVSVIPAERELEEKDA